MNFILKSSLFTDTGSIWVCSSCFIGDIWKAVFHGGLACKVVRVFFVSRVCLSSDRCLSFAYFPCVHLHFCLWFEWRVPLFRGRSVTAPQERTLVCKRRRSECEMLICHPDSLSFYLQIITHSNNYPGIVMVSINIYIYPSGFVPDNFLPWIH